VLAKIAEMPKPGTGCPRMPRTARSSATSKARTSSIEVRDVRLQRLGELDEGAMWPTSFAPKELTAAEEAKIGALVKKP
jgi:hypothetical protein